MKRVELTTGGVSSNAISCICKASAKLLITCLLFVMSFPGYAQVPQGINYQALAMTATGEPIMNATLQVKLTFLSSVTPDVIIWEELHTPVTTNESGLFTVVAGTGARQPASTVAGFGDIEWTVPGIHLRTSVYYQSVWHEMGTSLLWSVPYAFSAGNFSGTLSKLEVSGLTSDMDEALFEVKNKNGNTVFAVYNEGVRINVGDGESKALKGGFAIGGFDESKAEPVDLFVVNRDSVRVYIDGDTTKAIKGGFAIGSFDLSKAGIQDYLRITDDSIRMYINNSPSKAIKGGFAIGGFDESKGFTRDFLTVSNDSVRIYIDDDDTKAIKGGFAIGGFDESKGVMRNLMRVTLDSTRIYVSDTTKGFSVANIESGIAEDFMKMNKVNYFIGHESGKSTKPSLSGEQGRYNVFVGYQSGNSNTLGYKNVFLGYKAGMFNLSAEHNIFIGTESGISNQYGRYNTFLGSQSGALSTGSENTFIGYSAGVLNSTGQYNAFVGTSSGAFNQAGNYSTFVGWGSGNANNGSRNVFIGASAGSSNMGSGNVLIGYNANVSGSNKLMITNNYGTPPVPPLIYGEFNNQRLAINSATTNAEYTFYVSGTSGGSADWAVTSDLNKKKDIETISDALARVLELRGVSFSWKDESTLEKGRKIGFIAQEAKDIIPEVVISSVEGYSMQYAPITALLVEAMKEQQLIIDDQKMLLNDMKNRVENLESVIETLLIEIGQLKLNGNK